jgi:hypothetical protein
MRTRKNAREERGYARIHAHVSGMHADSRFSRSFALAVARKHKKRHPQPHAAPFHISLKEKSQNYSWEPLVFQTFLSRQQD